MEKMNLFLALLVFRGCILAAAPSFQQELVMNMAQVLLDNYCFPENLVGMQEAIRQAISSGEILHISDRRSLATMLTSGVQSALNDPRLVISHEPNYSPATTGISTSPRPEQVARMVRSSIKAEVLENNVGYLRIDKIFGQDIAEKMGSLFLGSVWGKIARTSSLIIDLRHSSGGDVSGIPYVVSYFSDPKPLIHIDTVYSRPTNATVELWTLPSIIGERYGKTRDLIILTSKRTLGAAEGIAYALQHLKRATVLGERSAGGSVQIEKLQIGESGFVITLPVSRAVSPITGQSWEVNGVVPSVLVSAKEALNKAKILLEVKVNIPKALQRVSDVIQDYYAFVDRVPTLLSHLATTDLSSVFSEEELAGKLNYELQAVSEDPRLSIKVSGEPPVVTEDNYEPEQIPNDHTMLNILVERAFKVTIMPGNTGYIRFETFVEAPVFDTVRDQMAKKVWESLKDTKNLIIDLRYNTGGPYATLPIFLSYLYDTASQVHFFTIYDRISNTTTDFRTLPDLPGPLYGSQRGVYILTSHHTASAGEEFAYLLQSLRRGTIIGEITSGALLHSKYFPVEGTKIIVTVPVLNFIDNHGECWLGGGVVPDAIVLAETALHQAQEIIVFHQEVQSLIEETGKLMELHYAIPEVAVKVNKVLNLKWADGSYRSVVDYNSLVSQLGADIQEASGDHRLHVFYCDTDPKAHEDVPKIPTAHEAQYITDTLFKTDILPGHVGYLRFDMMPNIETILAIAPQLLAAVWNKVVNTEALIIDLRFNAGGYSTAIPLLCTYFFKMEPVRHLYTVFDRSTSVMTEVATLPEVLGQRYGPEKDVYILTSHMTGFPAEAFVRTMKDLKRATIVGEPTIGGSMSSGTYRIRDSSLYASIPNQVVLSAVTGKVWSISGVEPHVASPAKDALNIAQKFIGTTLVNDSG